MTGRKKGFTLIELLVVIAIIAILIALLLPAVQAAREAARRTECKNHMKQLALACHNYHDTNFVFPAGWLAENQASWGMLLLPYVEFRPIFDNVNFNALMTDSTLGSAAPNRNVDQVALPLALFKCPSSGDVDAVSKSRCSGTGTFTLFGSEDGADKATASAVSDYLANSGMPNLNLTPPTPGLADGIGAYSSAGGANINVVNQLTNPPQDFGGVMFQDSAIRIADIADGTSNTALLAEHKGATCSTGSGNTICSANSGTTCYAYWAHADAGGGSETSGTTAAADVCFTPLFGINGSGLGWTGSATIAPSSTYFRVGYPGDISSQHEAGAQVALCDGSVRYLSQSIQAIGSGTTLPVLYLLCNRSDLTVFSLPQQ